MAGPAAAAPPAPPPTSSASDQFDRYNALMSRATKAKAALAPIEQRIQGQGRALPADIFTARNRLNSQLQETMRAFKTADTAKAEECLRDAQSALATIEKFVAGNGR
jgi:hypothetical protein